jgi:hypothetical protein
LPGFQLPVEISAFHLITFHFAVGPLQKGFIPMEP